MSLPDKLVESLRKQQSEAERFLIDNSSEQSLDQIKELADKKFLSLTGKAIDTAEEVMDYGAPKERLAAASLILDKSPATREEQVIESSGEGAIPMEAFKLLIEGMGKMFNRSLEQQAPSPILRALPDPVEEEPVLAPKRRKRK